MLAYWYPRKLFGIQYQGCEIFNCFTFVFARVLNRILDYIGCQEACLLLLPIWFSPTTVRISVIVRESNIPVIKLVHSITIQEHQDNSYECRECNTDKTSQLQMHFPLPPNPGHNSSHAWISSTFEPDIKPTATSPDAPQWIAVTGQFLEDCLILENGEVHNFAIQQIIEFYHSKISWIEHHWSCSTSRLTVHPYVWLMIWRYSENQ